MVKYNTLFKVIEDYTYKCEHYPLKDGLTYYEQNKKNFKKETWEEGADISDPLISPIGHLFKQQDDLQKEVEYSELQKQMLSHYGGGVFRELQLYHNGKFDELKDLIRHNSVDYWRYVHDIITHEEFVELVDYYTGDKNPNKWILDPMSFSSKIDYEQEGWALKPTGLPHDCTLKQWSNEISDMIEKSPRVQEDCIAWRLGRLPVDSKGNPVDEGQHGKYKGFIGLTYNKKLIEKGSMLKDEAGWTTDEYGKTKKTRYKIRYIVPKGTKGVVLGESVDNDGWQNELLLDKNQKAYVLKVNHKNRTATVLLY